MNSKITNTVDARNLNCPLPILKTKKALNNIASGELLEIQATDQGAVKDFQSFCEQTGNTLVSSDANNEIFSFVIQKA